MILNILIQNAMSSGGKREGAGRKKSAPTTKRTFSIRSDKFEEIVERIKALISFYNNA
jgi:hypothetical protein